MSRRAPRWVSSAPADDETTRRLGDALQLPPRIARLLVARGHTDAEDAKRFLRPRRDQLHAAGSMRDLDAAVDRLLRVIRAGETILVHGDYDVDGICATTILTRTLRLLGGTVVPFIPNRLTDGYDLGEAGVRAAQTAGASVVVTCDCGTTARAPVAALVAAGVDVIVSDHHLPNGELPAAFALLNPRRADCAYPDKDLCAAGLAFKLALAITAAAGASDAPVWRMLDLVALATVADVAPLRGENRVLVRYGLRMLAESENPGVQALVRAAGVDGRTITAGRVGFTLAPRLNAAGRIGHALRGVELLMAESSAVANEIARELEELNQRRQRLDRDTLDGARRMADALPAETHGMVLARDGWHPGVVGIVASRLVEEYGRPTVLVALDGDEGKGSGRSIPRFDLHGALHQCAELLVRFGGHRSAAGVTVARAAVEPFARRFDEVARAELTPDDLRPELRIDAEIELGDVTPELEQLLHHFEPFGVGNPAPVFAVRGARLAARPRVVGHDALKLRLADVAGAELDAIGWGMGSLAASLDPARPVDVAFRVERDDYRGESRVQARLADVVTP